MARPTKDTSARRKRWDVLYVTDAERIAVTGSAAEASLSVSKYILSLHAGGQIVRRDDWRRNVQLLTMVAQQFDDIARSLREGEGSETDILRDGSQSFTATVSLLNLERLIREHTMPWQNGQHPGISGDEDHTP